MRRKGFLMLLTLFMIVLALQTSAQATRVIGPYTPIYEGIEYATGTEDTPRLMKAFAIRVDLQNPNVSVFASHDNGTAPYETALQTPTDFVVDHNLKAAVNTCFYNAGLSPNTDVLGLLVSNGTYVSPNDYGLEGQILFDVNKVATLSNHTDTPPGVWNGCGTGDMILVNGANVGAVNDLQPRTALGLSQDNTHLIMLCIDGRQAGWSEGVNYYEEAQWLIDFGAYNGANYDGGGSTCMSIAGMGSYVNRPCYGYARAVGANLGVSSINLPTNPPYMFNSDVMGWTPGNSSSAIMYAPEPGWPGCMYYDQLGDDCSVFSPPTNFVGSAAEVISVRVYPQNGITSSHDMQIFWKTNAENYWDAAKSSPIANYTAMNGWAIVTLDVNNVKWTGQTINQLRLDMDNTNHGNRWIVDYVVRGTPPPPPTDIIIDNPSGVATGTWSTGTTSTDKYGADYRYDTAARSSTDMFTWTPNIGTAGNYAVYAWWPAGSNRSVSTPYTIYYNGGNQLVRKDQTINGGMWNLLGTYNFAVGTAGYVKVTPLTSPYVKNKQVMADAVRFIKQ